MKRILARCLWVTNLAVLVGGSGSEVVRIAGESGLRSLLGGGDSDGGNRYLQDQYALVLFSLEGCDECSIVLEELREVNKALSADGTLSNSTSIEDSNSSESGISAASLKLRRDSVRDRLTLGIMNAREADNRAFVAAQGVNSFPTVQFYSIQSQSSSLQSEPYVGDLSAPALIDFLNGRLGLHMKRRVRHRALLQSLTANTFDSVVLNPDAEVLVTLCGDSDSFVCQRAVTLTEQVGKIFAGKSSLRVSNVVGDNALCDRFDVRSGIALAVYFSKGHEKKPVLVTELSATTNDADSFLNDIVDFLEEEMHYSTSAQLDNLPKLNAAVQAFLGLDAENDQLAVVSALKSILPALEAELSTGPDPMLGQYCVKTMEAIVSRGKAFVDKEINRLQALLATDKVSDTKKKALAARRDVVVKFKQAATNT